jgi:hypothetical protein
MAKTIQIEPHGGCAIVHEHGQEWATCNTLVSDGDGFCESKAAE